jgi:hypothetical protein
MTNKKTLKPIPTVMPPRTLRSFGQGCYRQACCPSEETLKTGGALPAEPGQRFGRLATVPKGLIADAASNRLERFDALLPVLVGGAGLHTSGRPSFDGGLSVPHLPADLQTRRPCAFPMHATQRRQRHLEQPCGILLRQQALIIAHHPGRHGAPRSAVSHAWLGHWPGLGNRNLAAIQFLVLMGPGLCDQTSGLGSARRDGKTRARWLNSSACRRCQAPPYRARGVSIGRLRSTVGGSPAEPCASPTAGIASGGEPPQPRRSARPEAQVAVKPSRTQGGGWNDPRQYAGPLVA